jgi:glutamyl-tRNA synthetase
LLRAPTGERLAKRHGSETLQSLRAAGVTPAEVVGDLAASLGLATAGDRVTAGALISRFALPR